MLGRSTFAALMLGATVGCSDDSPSTAGATPQIALTVNSAASAGRGTDATVAIAIARYGGFAGPITFSTSALPTGVTATFSPQTLTGSATTSSLVLTVTQSAAFGTSAVVVTASGTGVPASSAQLFFTVPRPAALSLSSIGLGTVADRFTAELWVRGSTAYTTTWGTRNGTGRGNAVKLWDVSANTPVLVDSLVVANASTLGDVQVSDDGTLLVVAIESNPNGGLAVYQLDTPRSARLLVRTTGGELLYGVHTAEVARVNGVLYAFCAVNPANGVPARLVIVSLSNPAQPVVVASLLMGAPFVHDVSVRDGLLFTGEWNDGVGIWDIGGGSRGGTVAVPVRISRLATVGGKVHNVWWYHDPVSSSKRYLFVGEEGPGVIGSSSVGDVHVVDISTLTAPVEVARYTVSGGGTHNFSVDEANGLLYAAYYNAGVRVLDVRGDLGTCGATEKTSDGRCDLTLMGRERAVFTGNGSVFVWGVHWSSSGMFASDMLNGLWRIAPAVR